MSYSLSIADVTSPSDAQFSLPPTKIISVSDETISVATGKCVSLLGDDDILLGSGYVVTAASDLSVTLGGEGALSAGIVFLGTHDAVTAAAGTHMKLKGSDDQLVAKGAMDLVVRGMGDTVQGSSIGINLLGGSNLQLTGSNDSLTIADDDTVTLVQTSDTTISGEGYTVKGDVLSERSAATPAAS